jgi:hypothetical protein
MGVLKLSGTLQLQDDADATFPDEELFSIALTLSVNPTIDKHKRYREKDLGVIADKNLIAEFTSGVDIFYFRANQTCTLKITTADGIQTLQTKNHFMESDIVITALTVTTTQVTTIDWFVAKRT